MGPVRMKLTRYTDFSLRVLMYLARTPDRRADVNEIASAHGVSAHHLMKVAQGLARAGFVTAVRGRGGGLRLARPAEGIRVGEVVRATEGDCPLLDCTGCVLAGGCRLTGVVAGALRAYYAVLDGCSIAEVAQSAAMPLREPNLGPR